VLHLALLSLGALQRAAADLALPEVDHVEKMPRRGGSATNQAAAAASGPGARRPAAPNAIDAGCAAGPAGPGVRRWTAVATCVSAAARNLPRRPCAVSGRGNARTPAFPARIRGRPRALCCPIPAARLLRLASPSAGPTPTPPPRRGSREQGHLHGSRTE
jgi:hypothetical protein